MLQNPQFRHSHRGADARQLQQLLSHRLNHHLCSRLLLSQLLSRLRTLCWNPANTHHYRSADVRHARGSFMSWSRGHGSGIDGGNGATFIWGVYEPQGNMW